MSITCFPCTRQLMKMQCWFYELQGHHLIYSFRCRFKCREVTIDLAHKHVGTKHSECVFLAGTNGWVIQYIFLSLG